MLNLIGLIVAFTIIILLIRRKINFGLSLLIGSIILGLFSLEVIEFVDIGKAFIQATFYSFETNSFFSETIELALLLSLIFVLAKCMQETSAITKLINSLRTFFTRGGTLGVIPAVYGLMPVPGGALFSAPLIEDEGKKYGLNQNQKNFLNVWFRHIWFPIYPVSSAMILICSQQFSDIDIYMLILANIPAFIAFIAIGFVYVKYFLKSSKKTRENQVKRNYSGLIYLLPPTLPLVFYAVLQTVGVSNVRSFLIGVLCSIILVYFLVDLSWNDYVKVMKKSLSWKLALAIFGIMIFREMFRVSQANVLIADIISGMAIPALLLVILIPLLLGVLTGYNLGAIALSYFLVKPFFALTGITILGLTSIIFVSSLVGYLISPIHLCNVVSSEYLKTDTTRMYSMYVPAVILLLLVQIFFVLVVF